MNITLSIDEDLVSEARKIAQSMGKSLDQLIQEDLERLIRKHHLEADLREFRSLDGKGHSQSWRFDRESMYR